MLAQRHPPEQLTELATRGYRYAAPPGIREGVKRRAYARDGGWVDGVLYALVEEDLEPR